MTSFFGGKTMEQVHWVGWQTQEPSREVFGNETG